MDETDIYDIDTREAERKELEKALKRAREEAEEDLRWLMHDARGRRLMMRLLDSTGLRREPMTGDNQTFYNLGRMALGRELEADIFRLCPELYPVMIKENT